MPKKSSKKNRYLKAATIFAVLLLCLGGFFVFLAPSFRSDTESAEASPSGKNKPIFITADESNSAYPSISAKSAILIEVSSGNVIFSKNADAILPMASTTKIMTALVALENCDISKEISISPEAIGVEGSSVYLYPEETLTLEDLLYAMLLESANDAAAALAIEIGNSIEGFADMMNRKACDLGLTHTHFDNPHGLDSKTHYTTARELAIIARAAYSNEKFREIVSTHKKTIPLNMTEGVRLLINHNKLLNSYEGSTGIKTGFTKKSGRCLVSAAERDGLEFIAVTLNAPNDWNDHTSMLDYGFSLYELRILCDIGQFNHIIPVVNGDTDHVRVENSEKISAIIPRNYGNVEYKIELDRFVYAPIRSGTSLGRLVFYLSGKEIASSELIAMNEVNISSQKQGFFGSLFGK